MTTETKLDQLDRSSSLISRVSSGLWRVKKAMQTSGVASRRDSAASNGASNVASNDDGELRATVRPSLPALPASLPRPPREEVCMASLDCSGRTRVWLVGDRGGEGGNVTHGMAQVPKMQSRSGSFDTMAASK